MSQIRGSECRFERSICGTLSNSTTPTPVTAPFLPLVLHDAVDDAVDGKVDGVGFTHASEDEVEGMISKIMFRPLKLS